MRFYYDEERRLVGVSDHRGHTTQYVYANPAVRGQVTHVADTRRGRVTQLLYDEANLLVAVEAEDTDRYYVATDGIGSPIAGKEEFYLFNYLLALVRTSVAQ